MDGQIGVVFWIGMEVSPVAKASLYGNCNLWVYILANGFAISQDPNHDKDTHLSNRSFLHGGVFMRK